MHKTGLERTGDFAKFPGADFDEASAYSALRCAETIGRPIGSAAFVKTLGIKKGISKLSPQYQDLRGLVGGKIREELIVANWPDLFRCAATMATGKIKPSQLLRKLAAYPCQNDLATALREIGRVERTLFIMEWILDADMQRRAQIGLNKDEAHHALKNALRIGRQGKIRDRTTEGQALPDRRTEFAHGNHHLLEYRTPRPRHRGSAK